MKTLFATAAAFAAAAIANGSDLVSLLSRWNRANIV